MPKGKTHTQASSAAVNSICEHFAPLVRRAAKDLDGTELAHDHIANLYAAAGALEMLGAAAWANVELGERGGAS